MREPGAARTLVLAADVVPDVHGDHGRLVVLVHDEREPVVEHELLYGMSTDGSGAGLGAAAAPSAADEQDQQRR